MKPFVRRETLFILRICEQNSSVVIRFENFRAPGGHFSKAPETFRARKAIANSRLQSGFIHIFLI